MKHNPQHIVILLAIVGIGVALRSFNDINFPSIGYHNMRENEFLSIAQEMLSTGDYFTKRIYFQNAFTDKPGIQADLQPALVSYQTILAWNMFGENIWGPRLLNVIFGLLSIILLYLMAYILFGNNYCALYGALLFAVMPLGVFFSRNIQPEAPACFFMLLGSLMYLRYIVSFKKYNLFLGGAGFVIAWLYKFEFLIGILPFIVCLPYKEIWRNRKESFLGLASFLLPYLLIPLYILWYKSRSGSWGIEFQFALNEIFKPAYWKSNSEMLLWYIKGENYTWIYTVLACLGMCLAIFKRKALIDLYILGGILSVFVYALLYPNSINQNSYAQMPFLGLVCICVVYSVYFISAELGRVIRKDIFIYAAILIASLAIPTVFDSLKRMHGTVFLGEDVAGETLRDLTKPNERIFLFTYAQGYGISRYARRYVGWPENLADFKKYEQLYGVRFVCIYPGDFIEALAKSNGELFEYIQAQYHLKELGFIENPSRLMYLILEKGKGSTKTIKEALETLTGRKDTRSIYNVLGKTIFFYSVQPSPLPPVTTNEKK